MRATTTDGLGGIIKPAPKDKLEILRPVEDCDLLLLWTGS